MKKLLILAFVLLPSVALAQGYYNNPPPNSQFAGGFHNRTGHLLFGGSLGLGGMKDSGGDVQCDNCNAFAGEISGHLGGFVGPRLALMGELQGNVQTLSSDRFSGDTTELLQTGVMFAAQYWITPQLWIKGGIGFANLRVDRSYYGDGIIDESTIPENGLALLGAVGFELLSARYFSVDLQGRLLNGSYDSINYQLTAASVGVGINWY
jgi:hypothetical protein